MCLCAETLDSDSIVARLVEAREARAREARAGEAREARAGEVREARGARTLGEALDQRTRGPS